MYFIAISKSKLCGPVSILFTQKPIRISFREVSGVLGRHQNQALREWVCFNKGRQLQEDRYTGTRGMFKAEGIPVAHVLGNFSIDNAERFVVEASGSFCEASPVSQQCQSDSGNILPFGRGDTEPEILQQDRSCKRAEDNAGIWAACPPVCNSPRGCCAPLPTMLLLHFAPEVLRFWATRGEILFAKAKSTEISNEEGSGKSLLKMIKMMKYLIMPYYLLPEIMVCFFTVEEENRLC